MISHANMISQLRQMRQLGPVGERSTVLGILPFFHSQFSHHICYVGRKMLTLEDALVTGLVHLLHLPSVLGQDLIVIRTFDMRIMMDTIVKYHCTELWLVPRTF